MSGPSGNQLVLFSLESSCFPRLRLGKYQDSWENKTNCFPRDLTLSIYCPMVVRYPMLNVTATHSYRYMYLTLHSTTDGRGLYTATSEKVAGKSARDNPER